MNQSDVSLYNSVTVDLDGDTFNIKHKEARYLICCAVTLNAQLEQVRIKAAEVEQALVLIASIKGEDYSNAVDPLKGGNLNEVIPDASG